MQWSEHQTIDNSSFRMNIISRHLTAKLLREIILNNPNYDKKILIPSIRSWTQTKTQRDIWPIIWVTPHCLVHVPDAASEEVTLAVTRETPETFGSFSRKMAPNVWKEVMWICSSNYDHSWESTLRSLKIDVKRDKGTQTERSS